MAEFKGKPAEVTQVVDGLHIIDVLPKTIVCGCCIENVERIKFMNQSFVPERTCHMTCEKDGPICTVWKFDCCGFEFVENDCAAYQTELPGTWCPNCGAKVVE